MKEWLTANATTWTTLIILIVLILVNAFTKWVAALKRRYFEWGKVFEFIWTDVGPKFLGYVALLALVMAIDYLPGFQRSRNRRRSCSDRRLPVPRPVALRLGRREPTRARASHRRHQR